MKRIVIAGFAAGLGDDAMRYACPLFGGDTDRTPGPIAVSITAFGSVPHGAMLRRSTASPAALSSYPSSQIQPS